MRTYLAILVSLTLIVALFTVGCEPQKDAKEKPAVAKSEPTKEEIADSFVKANADAAKMAEQKKIEAEKQAAAQKPAEAAKTCTKAAEAPKPADANDKKCQHSAQAPVAKPQQAAEPAKTEQPKAQPAEQPKAQPAQPAAKAQPAPAPAVAEANAPQPPFDANEVVVTVNGTAIKAGPVREKFEARMKQEAKRIPPIILEQMKDNIMQESVDQMIIETILDQKIKEKNFSATPEEIDAEITKLGASQNPPLSIADIKSLVEAQGLNFEEWKNMMQLGKRIAFQKLMTSEGVKEPNVTEADAKKYYDENAKQFERPEQVKASHILIKVAVEPNTPDPNNTKQKAKAKAEELLAQIRKGADFATLAKENSDCPSKQQGGDLGYFSKGRMVPAFEQTAFAMDVNQVSDVVETQFGYHIIKVTDKKPASTVSFDEAKNGLMNMLKQKEMNDSAMKYVNSLKEKSTIVYSEKFKAKKPAADANAPSEPNQPK